MIWLLPKRPRKTRKPKPPGAILADFARDYTLTFKPGTRLLTLTDTQIKINGKRYGWDELQKGVTLDQLPKELDVTVEGTTPAGRRTTAHARLRVREPALPPAKVKSEP